MAYNEVLAKKEVKNLLSKVLLKEMTKKKMFGGLVFIIDEKMGINVSGENLMCRFHPALEEEVKFTKAIAMLKKSDLSRTQTLNIG